jgi:hypothetical protein
MSLRCFVWSQTYNNSTAKSKYDSVLN